MENENPITKFNWTPVAVANDIVAEVERQLQLWGTDFDDKNTANDWGEYILHYVAMATYSGRKEEYSPEKFKTNMKKAAALCLSAILAVERNGDCAPRHYEKLPRSGAKKIQE